MSDTQNPTPPDPSLQLAQAAKGLQECLRPIFSDLSLTDLMTHLRFALDNKDDLHNGLQTQARLLDSIFSRLVAHGMRGAAPDLAHIAAALKTQKQYRDTVRTVDQSGAMKALRRELKQSDYWSPDNGNSIKD